MTCDIDFVVRPTIIFLRNYDCCVFIILWNRKWELYESLVMIGYLLGEVIVNTFQQPVLLIYININKDNFKKTL